MISTFCLGHEKPSQKNHLGFINKEFYKHSTNTRIARKVVNKPKMSIIIALRSIPIAWKPPKKKRLEIKPRGLSCHAT